MKPQTTQQAHSFSLPQPYRHAAPANPHINQLLAEVERLSNVVKNQSSLIDKLTAQASRDPLTGLANRRGLEQALGAAMADYHRYGHKGALLMLDLNHFKQVNDTYGHAVGDAMLVHVANFLKAHTRETDTVARLGGDEFVVLLKESTAGEANAKALNLRLNAADTPCRANDAILHPSLSIGVATFTEAPSPGDLLSLADARMYAAKTARRQ